MRLTTCFISKINRGKASNQLTHESELCRSAAIIYLIVRSLKNNCISFFQHIAILIKIAFYAPQ